MKKGRNGLKLSVLLEPLLEEQVMDILFRESSTLGVRKTDIYREELRRQILQFQSSFGSVQIKESYLNGELVSSKPEFEELKKISESKEIPLKKIYQQVLLEYHDFKQMSPNK